MPKLMKGANCFVWMDIQIKGGRTDISIYRVASLLEKKGIEPKSICR